MLFVKRCAYIEPGGNILRTSNFRKRFVRSARKGSLQNKIIAVIAVIFIITLIVVVNNSLKPVIMEMAKLYGSRAVSEAVNTTVESTLSKDRFSYSDIVSLSYSEDGFVSAVEYDSAMINRLKISLDATLLDELEKLRSAKVKIPIGSLFGDLNLSGRGPAVKVRISQASVPEIEVISSFESVGINTVKNEIIVRITVNSELYLPPKKESFSYTQDFVIAQTIIVGSIPSGYVDIS